MAKKCIGNGETYFIHKEALKILLEQKSLHKTEWDGV